MAIRVTEPNLRTEVATPSGMITRLDMNLRPSMQWRCVGLARQSRNGRLTMMGGPLEGQFQQALNEGLKFKNGNPKFFVRDLDHGSHRIRMGGVLDVEFTED